MERDVELEDSIPEMGAGKAVRGKSKIPIGSRLVQQPSEILACNFRRAPFRNTLFLLLIFSQCHIKGKAMQHMDVNCSLGKPLRSSLLFE